MNFMPPRWMSDDFDSFTKAAPMPPIKFPKDESQCTEEERSDRRVESGCNIEPPSAASPASEVQVAEATVCAGGRGAAGLSGLS